MTQNAIKESSTNCPSAAFAGRFSTSVRPFAGLALVLAAATSLALGSGCGDDKQSSAHAGHSHSGHHHAASQEANALPANARVVPESGEITIESGDNMRFDVTTFVVRPGQSVELTLRHTGRMPLNAMGHNVVILKKYTDARAFAQAAARSASTDYIPRSMASQVIAHTKMLGGGESDTITFTAPTAAGEYDFICSFPAHMTAGMQGKMIVRQD